MKMQFSEEWWSMPVGLLIQVTASKVARPVSRAEKN